MAVVSLGPTGFRHIPFGILAVAVNTRPFYFRSPNLKLGDLHFSVVWRQDGGSTWFTWNCLRLRRKHLCVFCNESIANVFVGKRKASFLHCKNSVIRWMQQKDDLINSKCDASQFSVCIGSDGHCWLKVKTHLTCWLTVLADWLWWTKNGALGVIWPGFWAYLLSLESIDMKTSWLDLVGVLGNCKTGDVFLQWKILPTHQEFGFEWQVQPDNEQLFHAAVNHNSPMNC